MTLVIITDRLHLLAQDMMLMNEIIFPLFTGEGAAEKDGSAAATEHLPEAGD